MAQKLGIGPFALQRSNISAVRLATLLLQDDDPKELERREAERLQREVEKAQRDEQKRVSFMEKQKLLSQVAGKFLRMAVVNQQVSTPSNLLKLQLLKGLEKFYLHQWIEMAPELASIFH